MEMKVIFLRHATRHFTVGDVALNEKGIQQAINLSQEKELQEVKTILSSPKKRAQMTVQPLADQLNLTIRTNDNLDQMKSGESETEFIKRIESVLEKIEKKSWHSPLLICTHSDWLSFLMQVIPTNELDLKFQVFDCADHITFEVKDHIWYKK